MAVNSPTGVPTTTIGTNTFTAPQLASFNPQQRPTNIQSAAPPQAGLGLGQNAPLQIPSVISQPYLNAQQGYYGPLSQNPILAPLQVSDPVLQQIQDKLGAQLQNDPILNGSKTPHPGSVSVRGQMAPWQIAAQTVHDVVQQQIVDPIRDIGGTWQRNKVEALGEILGIAGTTAGLVALGAVAGPEAAALLAVGAGVMGAALTLPGAISAWSDEVANPTDKNLVKALVSTSVAGLSIAPISAFRSLAAARTTLEAGLQASKAASSLREVTNLFLGDRGALSQLSPTAPLSRQVEVLGMDPDTLFEQFQRRGINTEEGPAARLLDLHTNLENMQDEYRSLIEEGDVEGAANLRQEIKQFAQNELADARLQVSYHHPMLPNSPYAHVPMTVLPDADHEIERALDREAGSIRGSVRQLGYGSDLGTGQVIPVAKAAEKTALSRATGAAPYEAERQFNVFDKMRKAAGVSEQQVEEIWQAMEEPELWNALPTNQKQLGQRMRDIVDQISLNNLKAGVISHALQGRSPRYYVGMGFEEEKAAQPILRGFDYTRDTVRNPHRAWNAAVDYEGNVSYVAKSRRDEIAETRLRSAEFGAGAEHRRVYNENADKVRKWRRAVGQLSGKRMEKLRGDPVKQAAQQKKIDDLLIQAHQELGELGPELVTMAGKDLASVRKALPPMRQLLQGSAVMRRLMFNHAYIQEMAAFRRMLETHADMGMAQVKALVGDLNERYWGGALAHPEMKSKGPFPDILPETVFLGDGKQNPESVASALGYYRIHSAIGTPQDIHYRPALYAQNKLAHEILQAADQATDYQSLNNGVLGLLYKVGGISKHVIMASPVWHAENVAGRVVAWMASDPVLNTAVIRDFKRITQDPEEYSAMVAEFGLAGGKHADQFEVGQHFARVAREEDGMQRWPGALRAFQRNIADPYNDVVERGFWRMVDQFQLLAYMQAKAHLAQRLPGVAEEEVRSAAAMYASNLGGQVNPLYMNKVWQQIRNLVWFAPSYWGTFMRSLQSVIPGSARLAAFMAQRDGGRFLRLSSTPLRTIDYRTRVELTRMQRNWMTTYLATSYVAADMLNLIGSGHHIWDNAQGHNFDIDTSNFKDVGIGSFRPFATGRSRSRQPQPSYISSIPLFRQGADVANAMGFGHDYGFAHTINDPAWQQQDALHKAQMLGGSILDGVRRTASTKLGQVPQTLYPEITGEELSARLGQGVQRKIDRVSALTDLLPAGYAIQRAVRESGNPNLTQHPAWQTIGGSILAQYAGLPSVLQMGAERAPIDDDKLTHWQQERTASHDRLVGFSTSFMNGQLTSTQYVRKKEEELTRQDQLNRDTWGPGSSAATLADARAQLKQAYGLNDLGISDDQWFGRYDLFQQAWEQQLQAASPETRAQWWDQSRAQWTDADYLEWEAKQLKRALAASIDGQGGNYIQAYQNQLYNVQGSISLQDYQTLENADPYYSAYRLSLQNIATTSPLGAFVSAFSPTTTRTVVLPPGFSQADAQSWADYTGKSVVRSEEAQQLVEQAKLLAKEPGVGQAAGDASLSPELQQQAAQAVAGA